MDVYGLNPTTTAPAQPNHDDFDSEDWKAYWEGQSLSGQYFRNNVWWWRPLWNYVANLCSEVITEEDPEDPKDPGDPATIDCKNGGIPMGVYPHCRCACATLARVGRAVGVRPAWFSAAGALRNM